MEMKIEAPAGYEGRAYYDDGSRVWKAAFRKLGATWWTLAYLDAGHAQNTEERTRELAEHAIRHAIEHQKDEREWRERR